MSLFLFVITTVFSRLLFIIKSLYPLSSSQISYSMVADLVVGVVVMVEGGALAVLAKNVLCSATRGQCRRGCTQPGSVA